MLVGRGEHSEKVRVGIERVYLCARPPLGPAGKGGVFCYARERSAPVNGDWTDLLAELQAGRERRCSPSGRRLAVVRCKGGAVLAGRSGSVPAAALVGGHQGIMARSVV